MTLRRYLEGRIILTCKQTYNLPAPAEAYDSPGLDLAMRLVDLLEDLGDFGDDFGRRGLIGEELPELSALLFVVSGGVPADVCGLVIEEVGHEDLVAVGVLAGGGEDVGTLEGLGKEAEDVKDVEDGFGCCAWASYVC